MSKLSQKVRKVARQGSVIPAVVLDASESHASVRLSTNGAVYTNLLVVGGPVSRGDNVRVNFGSSSPFIMAPLIGSVDQPAKRTQPLEPIAHMNTYIVPTTGSGGGDPPPPGVANYNFFFLPAYGGSQSSGDYDPATRLLFGGGPYPTTDGWDPFGVSAYDNTGGTPVTDAYSGMVVPRSCTLMKFTPVVRMTGSFTKEYYIFTELYGWSINWSTGLFTSKHYCWNSDDDYNDYSFTGTLNGCLNSIQFTLPNKDSEPTPDAGDILVIYTYLYPYSTPRAPQPFYLQGYLVEMTG